MEIGLTSLGPPRSPDAWSGIPAALVAALERMGHAVLAVDARMAWGSERLMRRLLAGKMLMSLDGPIDFRAAQARAAVSGEMGMMRSMALLRHASVLGRLAGVVQLGSGYWLPAAAVPYVTYEDITVPQVVRAGYPTWSALSACELNARLKMQGRMYRRARGCCFTTYWAAGSAIADYGVAVGKVHVVGVGANHIVNVDDREWYPPRFLFVGMDWQRKNGDAVVSAFKRLRTEHPDARLDLVGKVPPTIAAGVTVHGVLGLSDRAGRQRIESLLRDATCFVMPSRHEPSALAYVEAAHAGLPCIVSSAGGSEELVGAGGIAVRPNDAHALLEAMRALSKPAFARATGREAHMRAQLYTWDAVGERVMRALFPAEAARTSLAGFL